MHVCVCVYMLAQVPTEARSGCRLPRAKVTGICEPPEVGTRIQTDRAPNPETRDGPLGLREGLEVDCAESVTHNALF